MKSQEKSEAVTERCPQCGKTDFVRDAETGEIVCTNCGFVMSEQVMDPGAEWRAITPEEKRARSRTGAPSRLTLYDKGLSTSIQVSRDAHGRPLSAEARQDAYLMRKWNLRSTSDVRNLRTAMGELMRLSQQLRIPAAVQERAALIYRRALSEGLTVGRPIKAMIAAALYGATRQTGVPRSLTELASVSQRRRKEIAAYYRLIVNRLDMKMPVEDPTAHVSKIASRAGVDPQTEFLAQQLLKEAIRVKEVTGKDPPGVAAAALYLAGQMRSVPVTQRGLAEAAGVTEVTVRNRCRGLKRVVDAMKLDKEKLAAIPPPAGNPEGH